MNIRVFWADGAYHGDEWPPSPLRLYSALVAGAAPASIVEPALRGALEQLAAQDPPTIYAPLAHEQAPVASAVPNNDGDVVFRALARSDPAGARRESAKLKTIRRRRPRRVDGPVTYVWPEFSAIPELREIASRLVALGQGIDTAWAIVGEDQARPAGLRWVPADDGQHPLAVACIGSLDMLEARYQSLRQRIDAEGLVHITPEPQHRRTAYRCELDPPARRSALFVLRAPDDRPWSAPGHAAMAVAAMTRHAIHTAARRCNLDDSLVADLMGHGPGARITAAPLPNVGHAYADGRIRRVLLTAPVSLDRATWEAVIHRLVGAELSPPGGTPVAMLVPAPRDDRLRYRYLDSATTWTSATPVILPGWDTRRGKPRPQRAVRRMLQRAGIDEALLASATLEAAPTLKGSLRCADARLPDHLAQLPRAHLSIRWRMPVAGPLALGAGTGYGYGQLVWPDSCDRSGSARSPGSAR